MLEEIQNMKPQEIEARSFAIIENELKEEYGVVLEPEFEAVIKRVIHTTADFGYVNTLTFTENVIAKAKDALHSGVSIVTDTNMAKAGINKAKLATYGGKVYCFMADEDVAKEAKERQITRAAVSMEKSIQLGEDVIYVIGNAPTALVRLYELISEGKIHPKLLIGVPVGFVNVVEAKEMILKLPVPSIVARGRKGGSNVAAAIVNALL